MRTIMAGGPGPLMLGRLGENEHTRVGFDISAYLDEYPGAEATILNQRPGDSAAYPVPNAEMDGTILYWMVQSADLSREGFGKCELVLTLEGVIVKSGIYITRVLPALDGSGDAPDPWQSWLETFQGYAQDAQQGAEDAQRYAEQAAEYGTRITLEDTGLIITTGGNDNGNP